MKKILLFAFCFISTVLASAQDYYSTALDLKTGENTYTYAGSSESSVTTHYKYTPTQDELLLIDHNSSNYLSVYTDTVGTSVRSVSYSDYSNYKEVFPLTKGSTYYIDVRVYTSVTTTTAITVATQATEYVEGDSCDQPIPVTEGKYYYFKAGTYDYATYSYSPHYFQYTPSEDGVLVTTFFTSVSDCKVRTSCDDAGTSFSTSYNDDHTYSGKFTVEAGKTYIISAGSYNANIVSFELTHPLPGSSCDMPLLASTDTLNVLAKEAGTYWYQIVSPKQGYAVVTSDATFSGGTITAWQSCGAYSASAETDGYLMLRSALASDSTLLLCIEKTEATAEDQTFSVAIESEQPGDSYANPIVAEDGGEYTTPVYNGTYWYKISVPADAPKRITVAAVDESSIQTLATTVSLYESSNTYYTNYYGNKSVTVKAAAGTTYYAKWIVNENKNNIKFKVTLEDLEPGDLYSTAIPAVLGENGLAKSDEKFYSYTATKSAKLIVDTDPGITVTFPKGSGSYDGYYEKKVDGTKTRINATAGTQYIIKFVGMTDSTTFTLSEEDYEEGETKASAIEMTSETVTLPSKVLDTWYYYVAPSSGKLTVTSDLPYEYDQTTYASSNVYVGVGANGYMNSIQQYDYTTYSYTFEGKTSINAGDTAYIHVVSVNTQTGCTLTCKVAEAEQGEVSGNPIPLVEGDNAIKQASYDSPVWYSINLDKGDSLYVKLTDYAAITLFAASDLSNELVYTKYDSNADYSEYWYYLAYKNEGEAGTFLLQVNNTYSGGTTANVQIIKPTTDGISNINADLRSANAIYDMQGRKVNAARLGKGLYIINGKKVIVK